MEWMKMVTGILHYKGLAKADGNKEWRSEDSNIRNYLTTVPEGARGVINI